jgi:hypothetical protein
MQHHKTTDPIAHKRGIRARKALIAIAVCKSAMVSGFFLCPTSADERAAAQELRPWAAAKILSSEPGRKACYERTYDAAHLRDRPKQRTTALIFFLRVSGYNSSGDYLFHNPHHIAYNFALSIKRRNDRHPLRTSGDCLGDKIAQCVVDCDGGGVDIEKPGSGSGLVVRLSENGIAFGNDCDTTTGVWVKPGADDKVFHLEPAPLETCESLEKATLGPWP